ncbi:MAG: hypothetical protein WCW78_01095 [Candidatus Paceibacterota bacterium]|jgi:flagellar basal body-associated protein FliL
MEERTKKGINPCVILIFIIVFLLGIISTLLFLGKSIQNKEKEKGINNVLAVPSVQKN